MANMMARFLVSETHCPNMHDHVVLPVSHSGMLFNRKTVELVVAFLHDGCFKSNKISFI